MDGTVVIVGGPRPARPLPWGVRNVDPSSVGAVSWPAFGWFGAGAASKGEASGPGAGGTAIQPCRARRRARQGAEPGAP